jgi:Protein of unknown function (DUF2690)
MRKHIAAMVLSGSLAVAGTAALASAPAASAGTGQACNGSNCTGLDPSQSYWNAYPYNECNTNASTPEDDGVHNGIKTSVGLLEVRWGQDCGVNWARFTPSNNASYKLTVSAPGDATQTWLFGNQDGVSNHTNQVYAPNVEATACVYLYFDHSYDLVACTAGI